MNQARQVFAPIIIAALGFLLLCIAVPARGATPEEDYLAARARYMAELTQLGSNPAKAKAASALDKKARGDLKARLSAMLGPISFAGLEKTPRFFPESLLDDGFLRDGPDALAFDDAKNQTRIVVSPSALVERWVNKRAKDDNAPAAYKAGLASALASADLAEDAVQNEASFTPFLTLPLTPTGDEKVVATLGLFSQDPGWGYPPNAILIGRLANGRYTAGYVYVSEAMKGIPACTALYKKLEAEENRAMSAPPAAGSSGTAEPVDAWQAFVTCFAAEAPKQPFQAQIVKRAEGLLAKMRAP